MQRSGVGAGSHGRGLMPMVICKKLDVSQGWQSPTTISPTLSTVAHVPTTPNSGPPDPTQRQTYPVTSLPSRTRPDMLTPVDPGTSGNPSPTSPDLGTETRPYKYYTARV